jgi:hypothetical protein
VTVGPDLAGFRAAQQRLRESMGATVTFLIPASHDAGDYAPGTSFDPESGLPFDPLAERTTDDVPTEVVVVASVVHRPIDTDVRDSAQNSPIGLINSDNVALLISTTDYPLVQAATEVEVWGDRYSITEMRADGVNVVDRYVIYLESR